MEELLPWSIKGTEERLLRRVEKGLRVKGTGVGQRVKGKEAERTMKGRYVCSLVLVFWVLLCGLGLRLGLGLFYCFGPGILSVPGCFWFWELFGEPLGITWLLG